jgi:hypothetical protein
VLACLYRLRHVAVGDVDTFEHMVKRNEDVLLLQDGLLNTPLHVSVQLVSPSLRSCC